jgi:hypothetical protein
MADNGGNGNGTMRVLLGKTGIPFLTRKPQVPYYKDEDPFYQKPQSTRQTRIDILDLSKPDHLAFYRKIYESVGLGLATVADEDRKWVNEIGSWKVFIRWFMPAQMDPGELRDVKLTQLDTIKTLTEKIDKERSDAQQQQPRIDGIGKSGTE